MKNLTLLFVLLWSFVSCQKSSNEEVTPDIAGIYAISTLQNMQNEVLTFPTLSADGNVVITSEIDITKIDTYQVNILRKGIAYGIPYTDPLGLFDIRKDGSEYIVYKDGLYVGSLNGKEVYLNFAGKSKNTMIATIRAAR